MTFPKKLVIGAGVLCLSLLVAALMLLSASRIESTPHGVHKRLLIPLGGDRTIAIPMYAGTGDTPSLPGFLDGPVVRRASDGSWEARWFCENRVGSAHGSDAVLSIDCAGRRYVFPVTAASPSLPAVGATPGRMLVLSDIEGNARFLDAALLELGVMDAQGSWTYGQGRLVIAGDAVDRGRDVFAVLWRLYALGIDAARQGGAVHLVLGNHEQYLLLGNTSRADREHLHALAQMGGQQAAFAADTVLGDWLRQQPVVMRLGAVMVTHGGASAAVASTGMGIEQLNDAMRRYWKGVPATRAELEAVIGRAGLTQYRGLVASGAGQHQQASAQDVTLALEHFEAATMVIGHTTVERITSLYGGRVMAINVNSESAASEALLFEGGAARVIPLTATRGLQPADVRSRPLRVLSAQDWRTLGQLVQSQVALSRLPFPY